MNLERSDNFGIERNIVWWGDSLTQALVTSLLQNMIQFGSIQNEGIGGQTAMQIACRQGGEPIRVSLTGGAFNGVNQVILSYVSTPFLSTPASPVTPAYSGKINGIPCIITRNTTGVSPVVEVSYTIRPVFSQNTVIADNSIFTPDVAVNAINDIQILWIGRNNVPNLAGVDFILDNMITNIAKPRRVVVIGVLNALNENKTTGIAAYNQVIAHNAIVKSKYPLNYVSSEPPTSAEMTRLAFTPDTTDLADIDKGTIPTRMRGVITGPPVSVDPIHLNAIGAQLIVNRVFDKLKSLNLI